MNAYRLKGTFPEYSEEVFSVIVVSDKSKKDVASLATSDGWVVKSVSGGTADDVAELPTYTAFVEQLKTAIKQRNIEQAASRAKHDEERARRWNDSQQQEEHQNQDNRQEDTARVSGDIEEMKAMPHTTVCGNCGRPMGKLESPHSWNGHVVCPTCFAILEKSAIQRGEKTPFLPTTIGGAVVVIILVLFLFGGIHC